MTKKSKDYAALITKEARTAAIKGAKTEAELDAMWDAWEAHGFSRDGLLYADVLARKQAVGVPLSEGDIERIELAAARRKVGEAMPSVNITRGA